MTNSDDGSVKIWVSVIAALGSGLAVLSRWWARSGTSDKRYLWDRLAVLEKDNAELRVKLIEAERRAMNLEAEVKIVKSDLVAVREELAALKGE